MTKFRCSMQKKIESLCKRGSRAEGIDDVVNSNAMAAAPNRYGYGRGRYARAQDDLAYNKKTVGDDWRVNNFLEDYLLDTYGIGWSHSGGSDSYKFSFHDKAKAKEFLDLVLKYGEDYYGEPLNASDFKVGRSYITCPWLASNLVKSTYNNCPEWQKEFDKYTSSSVREPVSKLKKTVGAELAYSDKQRQFRDDMETFKDELEDVIRNALKMSAQVEFTPRMWNGDKFRIMIDHDSTSTTSSSISKVVNKLVDKHSAVVGDDYIDMNKAAKVLADLEKSLG